MKPTALHYLALIMMGAIWGITPTFGKIIMEAGHRPFGILVWTLVIATATCRPGDAEPDRALLARPGTSIAFYMAVEKAAQVQADLIAAGAPAACPVDIVASVSTARQSHVETTLGQMAESVRTHGIASPALLMVRYPKALAAAALRERRDAA